MANSGYSPEENEISGEEIHEEDAISIGQLSEEVESLAPKLSPEQEKFTRLLTDILALTQELALEIVTLNCRMAATCPLTRKSKELVGKLKEMIELGKTISRPSVASSITSTQSSQGSLKVKKL